MEESREDPIHKGLEAIINSFHPLDKAKKGRLPMQPALEMSKIKYQLKATILSSSAFM